MYRLVGKRGPLFAPLKDHTGVIQLIAVNNEVSALALLEWCQHVHLGLDSSTKSVAY